MLERPSSQPSSSDYERTLQALIQTSSEVRFRVSADWGSLHQLAGGEFIADSTDDNPGWLESYIPPEDREAVRAEIARAISTKTTYLIEHRVNRLDGGIGWAFSRAVPLLDEAGNVTEWLGSASDITEHKRAAIGLRERETRLRLAIEAGRIGEWELDLATNTSVRALRHDQIFGHDAPILDWGLDTFLGHVLSEDRATVEDAFERAARTGAGWNFQCRIRRNSDDAVRWIAAYSAPQLDDAGRTVKLFGMVQDITDQKAAEIGLREMNRTLEQQVAERTSKLRLYGDLIQSSIAPICAFDLKYRLTAFNKALSDEFFRVYNRQVQLGKSYPDQFPDEQASIMRGFMARALAGEVYSVIEEFGDPAIIKPYWEINYAPLRDQDGTIIGAFLSAKDVSERLRAQAELNAAHEALRQSQKMEAVGQLTGGLAHDFNNLLAGISGSLELMQTRMQQGRFNDVERYMAAAQGAAKRAAALTHRLLAFSRRQTLDPKPTDVTRLAMGMQEMIQRTAGPGIPVEVVGATTTWPALVDPSQLENALLNLCINARDAMPDGGRIVIETANKWMDERAARQHDMPEGQYLSMCVTDTGTGMQPEVVARVFEPFFTTKPLGEGTGLGLSMIYGFAQQSGGQVRIYSEVGQGTTVCIYLPRYYGAVAEDRAVKKAANLPRSETEETVLVVDDEPTVRMLVTDILEDLGYASIESGDSATGLKVLQSDVRIDLLVTDVGLPGGMNGRQMADAARIARPDLKVLFITGYAENALLGNGHLAPGMAVLTKPFAVDTMAARIRSMIEGGKDQTQRS